MRKILASLTAGTLILALSATSALAFQKNAASFLRSYSDKSGTGSTTRARDAPYYNVFDNLAFRVDGGTVTLLGQVTRLR